MLAAIGEPLARLVEGDLFALGQDDSQSDIGIAESAALEYVGEAIQDVRGA